MEYNEFEEIAYIRRNNPGLPDNYDDDQLLNILDIIWDWQEENGFLEIDTEDDMTEADIQRLEDHTAKLLSKDPGNIVDAKHVRPIISSALDYESQL